MNNLSFIKRIDDLGRIVIPKDIRRKLKIDENENMEISVINDEIILKKHSLLNDKEKNIINIGNVIYNILHKDIIITNREKIIYSNNSELLNKEISSNLKEKVLNREKIDGYNEFEVSKDTIIKSNFISDNIIIDSNATGITLIYGDKIEDRDKLLLEILSKLIYSL